MVSATPLEPPGTRHWRRATIVVTLLALAIVTVRLATATNLRHTVFDAFHMAGRQWAAGGDYYGDPVHLFRWSPTAAAFFVPWGWLPERFAEVAWRWFNAAALAGALAWWLSVCRPDWDVRRRWIAGFAAAFASLANLNNGQANPLLLAAILVGFAAVRRERWSLGAAAFAFAVVLKVYPIALGLLLAAVHPRRFAGRLAAMVAVGFALAFACQKPAYVVEQFRQWTGFLSHDLRMDYPLDEGYRDLWLLLRLGHVPMSPRGYQLVQVLSGAAAAAFCVWLARRRGSAAAEDAAFSLGLCWCMLCGPATEPVTYLLLMPVALLALLDRAPTAWPARALAWGAFGLVLLAEVVSIPDNAARLNMWGFQPLAALLLAARAVAYPAAGALPAAAE